MSETLAVIPGSAAGADVGGTKIEITDDVQSGVRRYDAETDHDSIIDVFDEHFEAIGYRPARMTLAAASDVSGHDGSVQMTNRPSWPLIVPAELENRYPGTRFKTVNDMVGMMAGALVLQRTELEQLKAGPGQNEHDAEFGARLIISQSTGIGAARAVYSPELRNYIYLPGEGGHVDWQPQTELEQAYLEYRQWQLGLKHVSAELALSGKHGIENIARFMVGRATEATELATALDTVSDNNPAGKILREFATQDHGHSSEVAWDSLELLGSLLGSFIRNMAVVLPPRGGIYVTGSPMIALGEHYATQTSFKHRFVSPGTQHDGLFEKIPIYLVSNSHIAVNGALAIAQQSIS